MKNAGFSFTEILLNLVFLIVLVGIAVPSFSNFLRSNEIFSQRNDIKSALLETRKEAFRRNRTVSICAANFMSECSTDWSQGWIIFQDDGQGTNGIANDGLLNGNEVVISEYRPDSENKVFVSNIDGLSSVNSISFNAEGRPTEHGKDTNRLVLITVCDKDSNSELARGLVLSGTGMLKPTRDYDNDGVHEGFISHAKNYNNANFENNLRCS